MRSQQAFLQLMCCSVALRTRVALCTAEFRGRLLSDILCTQCLWQLTTGGTADCRSSYFYDKYFYDKVAFGSAPGVPNWGSLLQRASDAMSNDDERFFDTLFVVDPARAWYRGASRSILCAQSHVPAALI